MKKTVKTGLLVTSVVLALTGGAPAQSTRSTPAIESLFRQSITLIESEQYLQATQTLTRLIALPDHVHSQRAQELLGNVREANGQLAHAVAEYEIYLAKYPTGPGADRVSFRLNTILTGAAPSKRVPTPELAEVATENTAQPTRQRVGRPAPVSRPTRQRYGRGPIAGDGVEPVDPNARTVTTRGVVSTFYRYNEGATKLTQLRPDPIPDITTDEDDVFANALTTSLRISRTVESAQSKVTLSFGGNVTVDFEDNDEDYRLYDASVSYEDKSSGRVLTFGRQRVKPRGIAYRLDGATFRFPLSSGTEIGLFAGTTVESTRTGFFESDAVLFGVSASMAEGVVGPGEMSIYLAEERQGDYTNRQALGVEYTLNRDRNSIFANAEYDLKFGEFNRALLTGTTVFANNGRLTARLAYYKSPRLSLQNALIGQGSGASLTGLDASLTEDEIEDLALARSADVTTLGLTYYGPLNDKWNISAFGSLYDTSGKPATAASTGVSAVAAVAAEGVRSYVGVRFIGSSIFRERDQLGFGIRYSGSDDSDLVVVSSSLNTPVSERLTLRPRIRVGYRDSGSDGTEKFVIPSIFSRYKVNRQTSLQLEVGGRWSENRSSTTISEQNQFFFSGGVSRSF